MALDQSRAFAVSEGVKGAASLIFNDNKSINYTEYKTEKELIDLLEENGIEQTDPVHIDALKKFRENGTYGMVVGNTIITQDAAQAKIDIENGQIKAGTVILHEISHIIDDARMKTPESRKLYADNLRKAADSNENLRAINSSVIQMLDSLYGKEGLTFENSEKYRDEYTKYMQESLYAYEDVAQIEKEDSFMTRVFNSTDPSNLNTPEKALDYLAANNAAFRKGKLSRGSRKAIKNFKNEGLKYSDKSTVNVLAIEYKENPTTFKADDTKFTDFFIQAQSVAMDAMGYNVAKGDILSTDAAQFVATEIESVMKTFDPSKSVFTTHVFNSFKNRRANKFYKQEFAPKDIKQTRIGTNFDIIDQSSSESLSDRRDRENSETVSKIDPRSFRIVAPNVKKLENLVNITTSDLTSTESDFKSISSKFGAKLAESMYNISDNKVSKNANLTYAMKIVNGIPESSEAGRIQDDFNNDQEVRKFLKLLPPFDVP